MSTENLTKLIVVNPTETEYISKSLIQYLTFFMNVTLVNDFNGIAQIFEERSFGEGDFKYAENVFTSQNQKALKMPVLETKN